MIQGTVTIVRRGAILGLMPADKLQDVALECFGLFPVDRVRSVGEHDELCARDVGELPPHHPRTCLQVLIAGHQQCRHTNRCQLLKRNRSALRLGGHALLLRVTVNLQPALQAFRIGAMPMLTSRNSTGQLEKLGSAVFSRSCRSSSSTMAPSLAATTRQRRRSGCLERSHRPRSRRPRQRQDGIDPGSSARLAHGDRLRWCRAEDQCPDSQCCGPSRVDRTR